MSDLDQAVCAAARFLNEVKQVDSQGFNAWEKGLQMEFMYNLMRRYNALAQPIVSTRGVSGERIMFPDGSSLSQYYGKMGTFHLALPGSTNHQEYFQ